MSATERLAVAEVFIHHINTLRWLFGPLELTKCYTARTQADSPGEPVGLMHFTNAEGIPVELDGHRAVPGTPDGAADRLKIIGTRARILFEKETLTVPAPARHLSPLTAWPLFNRNLALPFYIFATVCAQVWISRQNWQTLLKPLNLSNSITVMPGKSGLPDETRIGIGRCQSIRGRSINTPARTKVFQKSL